jgi:hypothetical protein
VREGAKHKRGSDLLAQPITALLESVPVTGE